MYKILFFSINILCLTSVNAQVLNVYVVDSVYRPEPLKYTLTDSIEGKIRTEYVNFPGVLAFEANYYNSYRSGFVKYYYPSGKIMMTQVFQRSKKNGEFTLYAEAGEVVVKGEYVDNVKNGFWAYRKYGFMGEYKKGLKHGKWTYVLPDGKKNTYKYKNGVLQKSKIELALPQIPSYILKDGVVIAL